MSNRSESRGQGPLVADKQPTFSQVGQDAPAQGNILFNWFVSQTPQYNLGGWLENPLRYGAVDYTI